MNPYLKIFGDFVTLILCVLVLIFFFLKAFSRHFGCVTFTENSDYFTQRSLRVCTFSNLLERYHTIKITYGDDAITWNDGTNSYPLFDALNVKAHCAGGRKSVHSRRPHGDEQ